MTILLQMIGYAALVGAATWLLDRLRPAWRARSIAALVVLPAPGIVLLLAFILVVRLMMDGPQLGETDASGMVLMVYMVGGTLLAGAMLAIGLLAGGLTLRRLRRRP